MSSIELFETVSPLDYRYYGENKEIIKELSPFFSENARVKYQAKVEAALIKSLYKNKICSKKIYEEIKKATNNVKAKEVYAQEKIIKHDVRALVNVIRGKVSNKAKPFVHLGMTSSDVIDSANNLRFKEAAEKVLLPNMKILEKTLIKLALKEKNTLQVGRTHGQHAEPITFGFTLSSFIDRLGKRIIEIENTKNKLTGQMSGAVGAYNATTLLFNNPEKVEKDFLDELGLKPARHSTQIIQPEHLLDLIHSVVSAFGVLANLADDMRHLQRTEISEVYEEFGKKQVGSSTMPHKRNPINFENIKSFWKAFMPRITTVYMDQISEHQRDLTNSASSRFIPEIFVAIIVTIKRLNKSMSSLKIDRKKMKENFNSSRENIVAEPLYILLALHGHPNAHETVRQLTLESSARQLPIVQLALENKKIAKIINKFSLKEKRIIENPENYIGLSVKKTETVCNFWKKELKI